MMFGDVNSPRELEDDEITIESSRVRLTYGSKASIRVPIASLVQRVTWERELIFFLPLFVFLWFRNLDSLLRPFRTIQMHFSSERRDSPAHGVIDYNS